MREDNPRIYLQEAPLYPFPMNGFNVIFENNDRDNRLFDTNRPLHYAEGFAVLWIFTKCSSKTVQLDKNMKNRL